MTDRRANTALIVSLVAAIASLGSALFAWRSLSSYQDAALFNARLQGCSELFQDGTTIRTYYLQLNANRALTLEWDELGQERDNARSRILQVAGRFVVMGPYSLSDVARDLNDAAANAYEVFRQPADTQDAEAAIERISAANRAVVHACRRELSDPPGLWTSPVRQ